jgi:beta-lactamase superfamily II metal-dependent hydrolase
MADGKLDIVVWDVAHGSAIYMNMPNGRHVFLDAGASEDFSPVDWLRANHGIQQADALILSHQDSDHLRDIGKIWSTLNPRVFYRNNTVPRQKSSPRTQRR